MESFPGSGKVKGGGEVSEEVAFLLFWYALALSILASLRESEKFDIIMMTMMTKYTICLV